jgi:hypothetical protein
LSEFELTKGVTVTIDFTDLDNHETEEAIRVAHKFLDFKEKLRPKDNSMCIIKRNRNFRYGLTDQVIKVLKESSKGLTTNEVLERVRKAGVESDAPRVSSILSGFNRDGRTRRERSGGNTSAFINFWIEKKNGEVEENGEVNNKE